MQYYAAPMEGLTDRVWRQAQQKWFGPEGTAHRYYAPFLSPPENRVLIKKKMAELAPEVPLGLVQITERAMAKLPVNRYSSAAEMLGALDAYVQDPSVTFQYQYVKEEPEKVVNDPCLLYTSPSPRDCS